MFQRLTEQDSFSKFHWAKFTSQTDDCHRDFLLCANEAGADPKCSAHVRQFHFTQNSRITKHLTKLHQPGNLASVHRISNVIMENNRRHPLTSQIIYVSESSCGDYQRIPTHAHFSLIGTKKFGVNAGPARLFIKRAPSKFVRLTQNPAA